MAVNNQNNNRISSKLNKQHIAAKRMTRRSQGVSMKVFQEFNQNGNKHDDNNSITMV